MVGGMEMIPVHPSATRRASLASARQKLDGAPAHVRLMAAPYIEPALAALDAMGTELDWVHAELTRVKSRQINGAAQ